MQSDYACETILIQSFPVLNETKSRPLTLPWPWAISLLFSINTLYANFSESTHREKHFPKVSGLYLKRFQCYSHTQNCTFKPIISNNKIVGVFAVRLRRWNYNCIRGWLTAVVQIVGETKEIVCDFHFVFYCPPCVEGIPKDVNLDSEENQLHTGTYSYLYKCDRFVINLNSFKLQRMHSLPLSTTDRNISLCLARWDELIRVACSQITSVKLYTVDWQQQFRSLESAPPLHQNTGHCFFKKLPPGYFFYLVAKVETREAETNPMTSSGELFGRTSCSR